MNEREGRVVIVTGAATGIGQRTALDFAPAGAKPVIAYIVAEAGEAISHAVT